MDNDNIFNIFNNIVNEYIVYTTNINKLKTHVIYLKVIIILLVFTEMKLVKKYLQLKMNIHILI